MQYSEQQNTAIQRIDRNLLVLACSGSGKSEVIAMRVVELLAHGVTPAEIVAFTYTEKAAAELKSRIHRRIREHLGEIIGLSEMFVGTIHGFCLFVLQEHVPYYLKFAVLAENQLRLLVDKYYVRIGMKHLGLKRYHDSDAFIQIVGAIRENGVSVNELSQRYRKALSRYEKVLLSNGFFDFTMIMTKVLKHLAEDEPFQSRIRGTVRHLIVDEYQDVNPIQEQLIRRIHDLGATICAVGDDDQTIYQWRGSEIANILTFEKRYKAETVCLAENFRSTEGIVRLADSIICRNVNRRHKNMIASGGRYEEGDIVYKEFGNSWHEASFIVERIKQLREMGVPYSEMAILLRLRRLGSDVTEAMKEKGIPYELLGLSALFDTAEGIAAKSIFRYMNGDITYKLLIAAWQRVGYDIKRHHLETAIRELWKWKPGRQKTYKQYVFQEIFYGFIDAVDLKEAEGNSNKQIERILYNLGKVSEVINDFETIHFRTPPRRKLKEFCRFLDTAANDYPEGESKQSCQSEDAVRLLTIHQSKGLEFTAVFVPGLSRNIFPIKKFSGKSVWNLIDEGIIPNAERFLSGNIEDERRLFYVAITRAKKYLFLTRAVYNTRLNRTSSEFLAEAKQSPYIFEHTKGLSYRCVPDALMKRRQDIMVNFSMLEGFYTCPYRFKLSAFYGFNQPIVAEMGYGKSVHDMVLDIHKRAKERAPLSKVIIDGIIDEHMHLPNADFNMRREMRKKAKQAIERYYELNKDDFSNIEFTEKAIEVDIGDGIRVNGRIDLVKRRDISGGMKTYIVDFKTRKNMKLDEIAEEQLKIYALGYRSLTGRNADFLELYNLHNNEADRKKITEVDLSKTKVLIENATKAMRENALSKVCEKDKCMDCDMSYLCLSKVRKKEYELGR